MPDSWAIPVLDDRNRAFFTSGSLTLQQCNDCGTVQHPPEDICHACQEMDLGHVVAEATGTVASWAVMHYPVHPVLAERVPYNVVLVQLDDHPHILILGNVVDAAAADLVVGMPVEAVFEELSDPVTGDVLRMPQWRRRSA